MRVQRENEDGELREESRRKVQLSREATIGQRRGVNGCLQAGWMAQTAVGRRSGMADGLQEGCRRSAQGGCSAGVLGGCEGWIARAAHKSNNRRAHSGPVNSVGRGGAVLQVVLQSDAGAEGVGSTNGARRRPVCGRVSGNRRGKG